MIHGHEYPLVLRFCYCTFFAELNHRNMTDYLKLTAKLSNFDILRFYDDIMRRLDLQHTYNFNIRAKKKKQLYLKIMHSQKFVEGPKQ